MNEDVESSSMKVEEGAGGALRTFVGLFLVPLLVVFLCVAVFIGFGWIAYDHQSTEEYLDDLQSGWRPRRAQAAYELSKILVADPDALDDSPGAQAALRELFTEAEPGDMKRYLALVLGYTGDPEAAPLLIEALDDPDSDTRIYALMALGSLGDVRAQAPLVRELGNEDPGIRKTAAYALGELGQPAAIEPLQSLLQDPTADVRWNAALALSRLGSTAAIPVLFEMVDRRLTALVPDITPAQIEDAMVSAIGALRAIGAVETRPLLEELAASDPSLKVRQAALEALDSLET